MLSPAYISDEVPALICLDSLGKLANNLFVESTFIKRSPARWIFVTRLLMVLGLLCFLYAGSLYYAVFFDEAKIRAGRELSFAGISCWIAALFITARLGLFKWPNEWSLNAHMRQPSKAVQLPNRHDP